MIPVNELGVIVQFARQADDAGFEILSIRSAFPDAIVKRDGVEYRAEFEYCARNFRNHRHDIRGADIIICWENDWPDSPLPVLALDTPGWERKKIAVLSEKDAEIAYWKDRAQRFERAANLARGTPADALDNANAQKRLSKQATMDKLLDICAQRPGIGPSEIGQELGISRSSVYNHVTELKADNRLSKNGAGWVVVE